MLRTSSFLVHSSLGKSWWLMDSCECLASGSPSSICNCMYLEGAAQTEDTVVGLLGAEALEGGVDDVVLLGEQVISPVRQAVSSNPDASPKTLHAPIPDNQCIACILQSTIAIHPRAFPGSAAYLRPSCL